MRLALLLLLLVFLLIETASQEVEDRFLRDIVPLQSGVEWHRFTAGDDVDFNVVIFDSKRCALRVIDQPQNPQRLDAVMAGSTGGAIAGINAGFFTPEFNPLGLVISNGQRVGKWLSSTLLGGAVMVKDGKLLLLWREEVGTSQGVTQLVQAGPRLVHRGTPVAGLEADKLRPRSFIATNGDGKWLIGTASYATLAELANLLAQKGLIVPGFQVHRALNFDGGKSTALWLKLSNGKIFYEPEFTLVRNFVGIFPKK